MTPAPTALLRAAVEAARRAGDLQIRGFSRAQQVTGTEPHDIKLRMDLQSQQLIARILLRQFRESEILGEEGTIRRAHARYRWIVDPLDGTANYFYGVPLFSISIACQKRTSTGWRTEAAAVFDPLRKEMFTATRNSPALLNGRRIHAARRSRISEAMMVIGIFKDPANIERSMKLIRHFVHRTKKLRHMGSAALNACYVACGRFDAYLEPGVKLWDVEAGRLIIEQAGGVCELTPTTEEMSRDIFAASRAICPELRRALRGLSGSE